MSFRPGGLGAASVRQKLREGLAAGGSSTSVGSSASGSSKVFTSMKQAAEKGLAAAAAAGAAAKQGLDEAASNVPTGGGGASSSSTKMFSSMKKTAEKAAAAAGTVAKQGLDAAKEAKERLTTAKQVPCDGAAIDQLVTMGFNRTEAEEAYAAVGGVSAEAAAELLCSDAWESGKPVPASAKIQARMRASMKDVRRKAETLLGKAASSAGFAEMDEAETPSSPSVNLAAQRRAAAEAAERRLAEARARNAGTMEDWRRWRQEQCHSYMAQESYHYRPVAAVVHAQVSIGAHRPPAVAYVTLDDEEPASPLRQAKEAEAPSAALASPQAELAAAAEDAPVDTACAAAAAEDTAAPQDPELFELMLQQALAEEELELQQALTQRVEEERELLEQQREQSPTAHEGEGEGCEEPVSPADIEQQLAERLVQEKQLHEEQTVIQARIEDLQRQVALRESGALDAALPDADAGAPPVIQEEPEVGIAEDAAAPLEPQEPESEAPAAATEVKEPETDLSEAAAAPPESQAQSADSAVPAAAPEEKKRSEEVPAETAAAAASACEGAESAAEEVVGPAAQAGVEAPEKEEEPTADGETAPGVVKDGEVSAVSEAPEESRGQSGEVAAEVSPEEGVGETAPRQ